MYSEFLIYERFSLYSIPQLFKPLHLNQIPVGVIFKHFPFLPAKNTRICMFFSSEILCSVEWRGRRAVYLHLTT